MGCSFLQNFDWAFSGCGIFKRELDLSISARATSTAWLRVWIGKWKKFLKLCMSLEKHMQPFFCLLICVYIYHFHFIQVEVWRSADPNLPVRPRSSPLRIHKNFGTMDTEIFMKKWQNCQKINTSLTLFCLIKEENHLTRFHETNYQLSSEIFYLKRYLNFSCRLAN